MYEWLNLFTFPPQHSVFEWKDLALQTEGERSNFNRYLITSRKIPGKCRVTWRLFINLVFKRSILRDSGFTSSANLNTGASEARAERVDRLSIINSGFVVIFAACGLWHHWKIWNYSHSRPHWTLAILEPSGARNAVGGAGVRSTDFRPGRCLGGAVESSLGLTASVSHPSPPPRRGGSTSQVGWEAIRTFPSVSLWQLPGPPRWGLGSFGPARPGLRGRGLRGPAAGPHEA